jgi:putative transposase
MVDTLGLPIAIVVHRASIDERRGAKFLLARAAKNIVDFARLKLFYADQGYAGQSMVDWVSKNFKKLGWKLSIVAKMHPKQFELLPKRWIVERTFAWFNNYRRLSKDYEYYPKSSETIIRIVMLQIILKKIVS